MRVGSMEYKFIMMMVKIDKSMTVSQASAILKVWRDLDE